MALADLNTALNKSGRLYETICGAVWMTAVLVTNEDVETPNHTNRIAWASTAFANRKAIARSILVSVLQEVNIAANPLGTGVADSDYDGYVQGVVNGLLAALVDGV